MSSLWTRESSVLFKFYRTKNYLSHIFSSGLDLVWELFERASSERYSRHDSYAFSISVKFNFIFNTSFLVNTFLLLYSVSEWSVLCIRVIILVEFLTVDRRRKWIHLLNVRFFEIEETTATTISDKRNGRKLFLALLFVSTKTKSERELFGKIHVSCPVNFSFACLFVVWSVISFDRFRRVLFNLS